MTERQSPKLWMAALRAIAGADAGAEGHQFAVSSQAAKIFLAGEFHLGQDFGVPEVRKHECGGGQVMWSF